MQIVIMSNATAGFRVDHHIKPDWNLTERFSKYLSEQAFYPISYHGVTDFAGRRNSQAGLSQGIAATEQYKM